MDSVTNLLDERYSGIAMSKLETIPTLRSFLTCEIYGPVVEIFLSLIPAFYLLSLLSVSIQTELCHYP